MADPGAVGLSLGYSAFQGGGPNVSKVALRRAEPLSEHTKSSISFLQRVASVEITAGDKKEFAITVQLKASVVRPDSKATSYIIIRSHKEIAALQLAVTDACRQHVFTDDDGKRQTTLCALCEPLKTLPSLPVDSADRALHRKGTIQKIFRERLSTLLQRVVVTPSNPQFHCEGITVAPAAVAEFLLRGVDQSQL